VIIDDYLGLRTIKVDYINFS